MNPDTYDILDRFLDDEVLMPLIFGAVGIVAIVFGTLTSMVKAVARERTRRELAAYMSEGTITPEQAERLIKARTPDRC